MTKEKTMILKIFYKNKFPGSTGLVNKPNLILIMLKKKHKKIQKLLVLMEGHYVGNIWVCRDGKKRAFLRI